MAENLEIAELTQMVDKLDLEIARNLKTRSSGLVNRDVYTRMEKESLELHLSKLECFKKICLLKAKARLPSMIEDVQDLQKKESEILESIEYLKITPGGRCWVEFYRSQLETIQKEIGWKTKDIENVKMQIAVL